MDSRCGGQWGFEMPATETNGQQGASTACMCLARMGTRSAFAPCPVCRRALRGLCVQVVQICEGSPQLELNHRMGDDRNHA
eukprot:10690697-Alexandrium_andersonii.AAC.1